MKQITLFLFISFQVFAQKNVNSDSIYNKARTLAFSGQRSEAIALCKQLTALDSTYWDASILEGRIEAWNKNWDKSRILFKKVIDKKKHFDAYEGLLDVEIWSLNNNDAIKIADETLAIYPDNKSILMKKVKIYMADKKYQEAENILNKIISLDYQNADANALLKKIKSLNFNNHIAVDNAFDTFSAIYDNQNITSIEYKRNTKYGSILPRLNIAKRFEKTGTQFEIDLYPNLKKGYSLYLNYGFANTPLFPEHRMGAEIYKGIGKLVDLSLGFRNLIINKESILIYTGSLSKYVGNYVFSLRPFVTPRSNGVSTSLIFTAKKYLNDNLDYIMADLSAGNSLDGKQLMNLTDPNTTLKSATYYKSQQFSLSYLKLFDYAYECKIGLSIKHMEVPFSPGDYIFAYGINLGCKYKF